MKSCHRYFPYFGGALADKFDSDAQVAAQVAGKKSLSILEVGVSEADVPRSLPRF